MPTDRYNKLLRPDQVALRLNISKRSVYRLIECGCFVVCRIGSCLRVSEASLERYVRRQVELYEIESGEIF